MVVHERTLNVSHNEVTAAKCEPSVLHHTHVKCAIKMVSYFETVCVCVSHIYRFIPSTSTSISNASYGVQLSPRNKVPNQLLAKLSLLLPDSDDITTGIREEAQLVELLPCPS